MRLILWSKVNRQYFAQGSRPSKKDWEKAVLEGAVNGKIMLDTVFIDIDHFLSHDYLRAVSGEVPKKLPSLLE